MKSIKLFVSFPLLHKSTEGRRDHPLWQLPAGDEKTEDQICCGMGSSLSHGLSWCRSGVGLWVFTSIKAGCFAKPRRRAGQSHIAGSLKHFQGLEMSGSDVNLRLQARLENVSPGSLF